jgi:hypothetical protein
MKNTVVSILAFLIALIILSSGALKSNGPPGCHAGEPPANLNCTSCHFGAALNSGSATVSFDLGGADTGYIPGATYTITVSVQKNGLQAAGFQSIALLDKDHKISPGTVTLTEPTITQTVDVNNPHAHGCNIDQKVWIEHTFDGITSDTSGLCKWVYNWKAPDAYIGNVTFYLSVLESNYDGTESGDYTYTRSIKSPDKVTSINSLYKISNELILYPNPANSKIYVKAADIEISKIELMDTKGQSIKQFLNFESSVNNEYVFELGNINSGMYFIKIQGDNYTEIKKILILQ